MIYMVLGQDLLLGEATKLSKWWAIHKATQIYKGEMGILITKSPNRSSRGNVVYDVYLSKQEATT
mgnify:CR=1 FL=1